MLPWMLAAVLTAGAQELEVGVERRLGFGLAAGFPPTGTLKYYADERNGFAVHLGPTLAANGVHTRIQYERWLFDLKSFEFGVLGLTMHAGVLVNLVFGQAAQSQPIRPGVVVGVGAEFRLAPAPVAAFVEVGPTLFPLDLLEGSKFLPAGVTVVAGARWYIGTRRSQPVDPEESEPP